MSTKAKNHIVGLKEFRENADDYIKAIGKGRSFTVVRRSRPVFRMVPVDAWGDDGEWETIVDFTKIKKGGVPIDKVLEAFKRVNAQNR